MRTPFTALLITTLLVSACGDSRLNPLNWFGRGRSEPVATGNTNPLIPQERNGLLRRTEAPYAGQLISKVTELKIERVPGGGIVRATGVGHYQGSYEVKLIELPRANAQDRTQSYEFRAVLPAGQAIKGTEWSRTITAAVFLTDNQLADLRTIRVVAAENAMSSRR